MGMLLRRLRHTAYMARHLRRGVVSSFRPAEAVGREQRRRVRRMVTHAWRYVPWYREAMDRLGLTPDDFRDVDDLARLPLIERKDVQRDPERFRSTDPGLEPGITMRTGGSTGMPLPIAHDARSLLHCAAESQRERDAIAPLVGRRFGYREALVAPPINATVEVRRFCAANAWFPRPTAIQRVWLSLLDPPEQVLADLNRFQPDVIHCYGSYLAILFRHLHETGAPLHRPSAILYGSDGLAGPVRRLINEEFGIPVFSVYGAIEAPRIAFECEQHVGQHVNAEWYPVRIVDYDGRPLPPGEEGQVVLSNLVNRATVLLNYRQGDLASLLPAPCPCGRALPLMSFVNGRRDDLLHLPDGRVVHPMAVRLILSESPDVWEYQVVQEAPLRFHVCVLPVAGTDRETLRARLSREFAMLFGPEVETDVHIVDSLGRTPTGKHRVVVTRASLEEEL